MQLCASLTAACTDLKCSFDLRAVVNVEVQQGEAVGAALRFEAAMQKAFYQQRSV